MREFLKMIRDVWMVIGIALVGTALALSGLIVLVIFLAWILGL